MRMTYKESTRPSEIQDLFYQTRKKLSDEAAKLPQGVIGPFFNDEYSDVYFALYALEAEHLPHRQQVQMAEELRQGLLNLPGVKKVNILGEQAQRVFVEFSYERLATLGIKPDQIFAALAAQNAVAPSGFVETAGARAYIRIDGAFDSLSLIENVPLEVNGRVLRIANVVALSSGARFGFVTSQKHVFGAAVGFTLLLVLIGLGLHEVLVRWPILTQLIQWGGVALPSASRRPSSAASFQAMYSRNATPPHWINWVNIGQRTSLWLTSRTGVSEGLRRCCTSVK
jgi:hypothetical protein